MKSSRRHFAVLVTVPNRTVARRVVSAALDARAAACGNILPGLESHYWWKGKKEKSAELLVIFKTTRARLPRLEEVVREKHPYETPEFVVLPLVAGSPSYLDWLDESTGATGRG